LSPEEIDKLPEYTDEQLLKLYRAALVEPAEFGVVNVHLGKTVQRITVDQIRKQIEWLEARIERNNPAEIDNSVALVVFGRPPGI
jgi:hypothetical protein